MLQATIHVACLCAGWCHLCDDYRAVVRTVVAEMTPCTPTIRWHWIDIEDEADLIGDVDVETFPTLVVADGTTVRFAGALTPQPDTLRLVLRATVVDAQADTLWPAVNREFQAFAVRLGRRTGESL